MSSAIQTYKYRLKDRHAKKALRDLAFAVNQVWDRQRLRAWRRSTPPNPSI